MIHLTVEKIEVEHNEEPQTISPASSNAGAMKEAKAGIFRCPVYVNFKKNRLQKQNERAEG